MWFEHPGHTYGGFVPSFSEWGMPLNLRQQKWLYLIKDYDLVTNYHTRKVNVEADALSWRSHISQLIVENMPIDLSEEFDKLNSRIVANTEVIEMEVDSTIL
jgi:hypothetical protein